MSVPKKKRTSGSVRRRQSHDSLTNPALTKCSQCKQIKQPHTACPNCGYYRGRAAVAVASSVSRTKKAARA